MRAQYELHTGNYAAAENNADEAVGLKGRTGETLLIEPDITLAHARIQQDDKVGQAISVLDEAARKAADAKDDYSQAYAKSMLGLAYMRQHDLAKAGGDAAKAGQSLVEAKKNLDESIDIHRSQHGTWGAISTYWRGDAALLEGDRARAERQYKEALEIGARLGARRFVANALRGLAAVQSAKGHQHSAAELLGAGESVRRASNTSWGRLEAERVQEVESAAKQGLKENYESAWEAGYRRTMEQAITYARSL